MSLRIIYKKISFFIQGLYHQLIAAALLDDFHHFPADLFPLLRFYC